MFGGFDGGKFLNDVHTLELERGTWNAMNVSNNSPAPRGYHSANIISHFMLIMGGHTHNPGGGNKALGDVHVLDLSNPSWEVLDDGLWTSSRPWLKSVGAQGCKHLTVIV